MYEANKEKTSAYNEAVSKVNRIAELQNEANRCFINGEWNECFNILIVIYLEISSKLIQEDIEFIENEIKKCNKVLIKYNNLSNAKHQGLRILNNSINNKNNIYYNLFRLRFSIGNLIEKSGYGSPDKEDELF